MRTILSSLIAVLLFLFPLPSFSYDFKGDNIGEMTLSQFKTKYYRISAKGQYAPVCTDTNPKTAGIESSSVSIVNCSLDYPFERNFRSGYKPPTVGGVPVLADMAHPGIVYRFVDSLLWRVEVEIKEDHYSQLRQVALGKYGDSPNRQEETVELRGGRVRHGEVLSWESEDRSDGSSSIVKLYQVHRMAGVSALVLYNLALEDRAQAILKTEAGKGVDDM